MESAGYCNTSESHCLAMQQTIEGLQNACLQFWTVNIAYDVYYISAVEEILSVTSVPRTVEV